MSDFSCRFVFQHKYGKKWATYSDNELDILNKALRKFKKSVSLPSKDPKIRIVVNFEDMTHRNKVSNFERRVRCLMFTTDFHAWMWKDEDDEYSSFRPFQVYFLEYALLQDLKEIKFFNFGDCTVNLKSLELLDEDTHHTTPVIREVVSFRISKEITAIKEENSALYPQMRDNEDLKSLCNRRIFDVTLASKVTPSNSSQLDLSASAINEEEEESSHFVNKCVDPECPNADWYKVYSVGEQYYGASLTYTNLENNINKYIIMQILVRKDKYYLWQRWSRIGYKAQHDLCEFGSKLNEVIGKFEDKFFKKTKNKWQNVSNFKKIPGSYDLLQMDLTPEEKESPVDVESQLPEPVQDILKLITSRKMMNKVMKDMNYDLVQAPLGKLTVSQIKEGYSALNKIAELISQNGKGKDLINACDEFYTKIPHNFGRSKPPVISTLGDVEEKLKMLEALLNINIAVNILNDSSNFAQHPLDRYYISLNCGLKCLDKDNADFLEIQKSILDIHGPTHTGYDLNVLEVFSCNKITQSQNPFVDRGNKLLLWHGSRMTNWVGILKEGLRIAPPEAPSTGCMFGKGLYFADVCSKSANYCFPGKNESIGLLILCEVSLGKSMELFEGLDVNFRVPTGYDSVVGKGKWVPTGFEPRISTCDAGLPFGPIICCEENVGTLTYNEYVIYNTKQVRMKYLVKVKFNFKC